VNRDTGAPWAPGALRCFAPHYLRRSGISPWRPSEALSAPGLAGRGYEEILKAVEDMKGPEHDRIEQRDMAGTHRYQGRKGALNGHGGDGLAHGLSGSGKSTVADLLAARLHSMDVRTAVLTATTSGPA
jgi:hypothetical protein